jgi:hypothetical protein
MKYEEELRGLQEVRGTTSPPASTPAKTQDGFPFNSDRPTHVKRDSGSMNASPKAKAIPSARQGTPLGVRARLNSLARQAPALGRPQAILSSSTLTLQGLKKNSLLLRPTSPAESGESSSGDEAAAKEEAAERANEEQSALTKKLQELKMMMTDDRLGLVQASSMKNKGKQADRPIPSIGTSPARLSVHPPRDETSSASVSSTSSAHNSGSMPSMSSPPADHPTSRHMSPAQSGSPPVLLSPRRPLGPGHSSHRQVPGRRSDSSAHDSPTSSFSDLSDASLSESAFMSNKGDSRM